MIFWKENFVGVTDSMLPQLRKTLEEVNDRQMKMYDFLFSSKSLKSLTV